MVKGYFLVGRKAPTWSLCIIWEESWEKAWSTWQENLVLETVLGVVRIQVSRSFSFSHGDCRVNLDFTEFALLWTALVFLLTSRYWNPNAFFIISYSYCHFCLTCNLVCLLHCFNPLSSSLFQFFWLLLNYSSAYVFNDCKYPMLWCTVRRASAKKGFCFWLLVTVAFSCS